MDREARFCNKVRFKEEASIALYHAMISTGVSRSELARRLGVSKSWVSKVMVGQNHKIETLADMFGVMGISVHLTFDDDTSRLRHEHKGIPYPTQEQWDRFESRTRCREDA